MANNSYPVGFYFSVSIEGEDIGFQEVSGISKTLKIEEVQSGGENRFKYKLPTITTNENLVLKRALVLPDSVLVKWCNDSLNSGLSSPVKTKTISVNLLNSEGDVMVNWVFYNAYPIKYSISDLHSQRNELVFESIELAYTYFDSPSK